MFGKSHIDYETDRGLGETSFGTETWGLREREKCWHMKS